MKKQILLISILCLFSLFLVSNVLATTVVSNDTNIQALQAQIDNLTSQFMSLQQQCNNITLTPGPKGDKGDQGNQGIPGVNGTNGKDGINGINGVNGSKGLKGDKGDKGDIGLQGLPGMNGLNGLNGLKGDKGNQGIPGVNGTNGKDGINGINGRNGTDGTNATVDLTPLNNRVLALENFRDSVLTFFKSTFGVWYNSNGQLRCSGNTQQKFINNTWVFQQNCQYGCTDGICNSPPATKEDCTKKKVGVSCSANNDKYQVFLGCKAGHGTSTSCDIGYCSSSGVLTVSCPNGCDTVTNLCK